jgi:hypothetical protein
VTEKKSRTNPYSPPILAMTSDDTQLIIESDGEFPAESGKKMWDEIMRDTVRKERPKTS